MTITQNSFYLKKSSLPYLLVWILVLLYNPILYKTVTIAELGKAILLITISAITGISILKHSNTITDQLIIWPVSILIGSLIIGTCILFIPSALVISALLLITVGSIVVLFLTPQNVTKDTSEPLFPIIWLLPAFIIIFIHQFAGTDYIEAQAVIPFQGNHL